MNALLVGLGRQGQLMLNRLTCRDHKVLVTAVNSHAKFDRYLSDLSDPYWDTVFICSSDNTHAQYAKAAFENGKNVYVEKPVGVNLFETSQILFSQELADTVLCAGYQFLWHPIMNKLMDQSLDNWHFRWTKPTKSKNLDRTLMSHHISMAIQAWGKPIFSNIIQTDQRCLGQFIFENNKTMTSNIRLGDSVIHEAEVRQKTGVCNTYNLQRVGDPDPIDLMLNYFESRINQQGTYQPNWQYTMKQLILHVAEILDE